jgi:hypothetical protein
MALNVGLYVSFGNISDCKEIRKKSGDVNSVIAYVTNETHH